MVTCNERLVAEGALTRYPIVLLIVDPGDTKGVAGGL